MKAIVAGGRDFGDAELMHCILVGQGITEVVSGTASGADLLGEEWARKQGIPIKKFPADWARYGRGAGPKRNREMAEYAEALFAFWDGKSRGTANMIDTANSLHLRVTVIHYGR